MIGATAFAQAPITFKLNVMIDGKTAGTASGLQKVTADGGKFVTLNMTLKGNLTAEVRTESTYDAKGAAIRRFMETSIPQMKYRQTKVVTFDSAGAHLVQDENGTRSSKLYALDSKQNRDNSSEFWFFRDKPKPGTSVKYFDFNLSSLSWDLKESTYLGDTDLKIGKESFRVHKVKSTEGTSYLDDKGAPVKIVTQHEVLERIP